MEEITILENLSFQKAFGELGFAEVWYQKVSTKSVKLNATLDSNEKIYY